MIGPTRSLDQRPLASPAACEPSDPRLAALYSLLSRLFACEISQELYRVLGSTELESLLEPHGLSWLDEDLRSRPEVDALEELAAEYYRLFVAPGSPSSPYASVQQGEALIGGRARAKLERFLDEAELEPVSLSGIVAADHIATYLAVLAELHRQEQTSAARATFSRELVAAWLPQYLDTVASEARFTLYRTSALLARGLVDLELAQATVPAPT